MTLIGIFKLISRTCKLTKRLKLCKIFIFKEYFCFKHIVGCENQQLFSVLKKRPLHVFVKFVAISTLLKAKKLFVWSSTNLSGTTRADAKHISLHR